MDATKAEVNVDVKKEVRHLTQMSGSIQKRVQDDRIQALKAKDSRRSTAISLILAAFKQKEVDTRQALDDSTVLGILDKMLKERRQSLAQYETAARQDLADQENFEIELISSYLPSQLSEPELEQLIKDAIRSLQANSIKDMGKVVAALKPQIQGRADVALVSKKVKDSLSSI